MTLRDIVDTALGFVSLPPQKKGFAVKDQVIVRRPVGFSGKTSEILNGEILSFSDKNTAIVSMSRPGGVLSRATVPINQLQHASQAYRRDRVNVNPAFRGQM